MRIQGTSKTKQSKYNSTVTLIISIGMLLFALMAFDLSNMPPYGKLFIGFWIFGVCMCTNLSILSKFYIFRKESSS